MERLTQRMDYDYEYEYGSIGIACDDEQYLEKVYNKLGRLEDLEEELGIDLITLFKALKEGIYYLEEENIFFSNDVNLWCGTSKNYYISGAGIYKKVKDYGKTWSLDRSEFENE